MDFVGIDVGSATHWLAVVDEAGDVRVKPTAFAEDAEGYHKLLGELRGCHDPLIVVEATGHYWQNLVAVLVAHGFATSIVNPLRTRRFAEEDLKRAKTDSVDALIIARFAAQKRPAAAAVPEPATRELRELVRYRDRLMQDFGDRLRQLHRLVDLGFPEFRRFVKLDSQRAWTILREYPTAQAFAGASRRIAGLRGDGRNRVGAALARALVEAAGRSIGQHHGAVYRSEVRHTCDDLRALRSRIREIDEDVARTLKDHEVGSLLTTIDGVGTLTAARLVGELGNPAAFRSAAALAAHVGVVPGTNQSGKRKPTRAGLSPLGHARLRTALYMPTLVAVHKNPWLAPYYRRLIARGKPRKVALLASMRKLLAAVYSVAKNRRPFVPLLPPAPLPPNT